MRRIAAALFVFTLICSLARLAPAQEGSATLTGFIQDPGKADSQRDCGFKAVLIAACCVYSPASRAARIQYGDGLSHPF
jgi:hypothetical protein